MAAPAENDPNVTAGGLNRWRRRFSVVLDHLPEKAS
jgi:hypothetical protein